MDKVIKLSQQFYKQYKDLKRQNKDITHLNNTVIYADLRISIDQIDIDKTFNIQDSIQFGKGMKLGYSKLYEEEGINMGIFFISQFEHMPLHDHPDMFVFTRPLYGKAKKTFFNLYDQKDIKTQFDYPTQYWQNEALYQNKEVTVRAQLCEQQLREKGDRTQIIEPNKYNLHEIFAVENFAFLDVLIPDYDLTHGKRYCNFYYPKKIVDPNQNIFELKIKALPDEYDIQELPSPLIKQEES